MMNDARRRILLVGANGAAGQASRRLTMVTGRGDALLVGDPGRLHRPGRSLHESDLAPDFIGLEAVQAMTGRHAGLTARAGIEVDAKGVLLTLTRRRRRHERLVAATRRCVRVVVRREGFDGAERALLFEQQLDQLRRALPLDLRAHPECRSCFSVAPWTGLPSSQPRSGGSLTKSSPERTSTGNVRRQ